MNYSDHWTKYVNSFRRIEDETFDDDFLRLLTRHLKNRCWNLKKNVNYVAYSRTLDASSGSVSSAATCFIVSCFGLESAGSSVICWLLNSSGESLVQPRGVIDVDIPHSSNHPAVAVYLCAVGHWMTRCYCWSCVYRSLACWPLCSDSWLTLHVSCVARSSASVVLTFNSCVGRVWRLENP